MQILLVCAYAAQVKVKVSLRKKQNKSQKIKQIRVYAPGLSLTTYEKKWVGRIIAPKTLKS